MRREIKLGTLPYSWIPRAYYSPKDGTSCRILVRPDGAPIIYLNGAQTVHTDEPCVLCGEKIDCGEKEVRRESCRTQVRSWRDLVIGIPVSHASGRPTNAALAQEHVANLRRLSDSFSDEVAIVQANKPGSGTLYAHAIVSTELPVCGLRLEVPFGQTMLTEFDRHLRTYGFSLRDRRRDATRVSGGSEHELYSPDTDQARVLNASGVSANVLVRTPTLDRLVVSTAKACAIAI
eukprot:scaffold9087_cov69-Phaeocystis_antarctica.AAC.1